MKTVVFQSFRTRNVPGWIAACLASTRDWTRQRGYEYRFFDDAFFELVPEDLRARGSHSKCLLADYARLVAARKLLDEGFSRAVWIDADALVFAPEDFEIPLSNGYAFCREVWLDRITLGRPQFKLTVNNAVSVFCQDETIIPFYLDAAAALIRSSQTLDSCAIGTDFLVRLRRAHAFPLLTEVGMLGPEMMHRYLEDDGSFLRPYLNYQTSPVRVVNLCLSHRTGAREITETQVEDVIARLKADRGASFNAWFDRGYHATAHEFDRPLSRLIGAKHAIKNLMQSVQQK